MTRRSAVAALWVMWVLFPRPAAGQVLLQDFEQGLKYDQCFAGDNVSLSTNQPLQGAQQLATGPLNKNKVATYLTPFLQMRANGFVRFVHRNEDPGKGSPTIFVDLMDAAGNLVTTIYTRTYPPTNERIVVDPQVPADGLYRVRFRFVGDRGSERAALDELNIDGAVATTGPPCIPVIPGNPPMARPDSATSLAAQPISVNVLGNDEAGSSPIAPATVDLAPEDTLTIDAERDIRDGSGQVIGRAVVDSLGNVTVTPSPTARGTLVVPYSVRDTAGRISNTTQLTVTVLEASTDLAVELSGATAVEAGSTALYTAVVRNLGPAQSAEAQLMFQVTGPLTNFVLFCPARTIACGPPVVSGSTVTAAITGLGVQQALDVRLIATASAPGVALVSAAIAAVNPATDPVPGNNSASVSTIVGPAPGADVAIAMTGPTDVQPGTTFSYTLAITNNGPDPATGVSVTSAAPAGAVFVGNQGGCTTAFPCALGTLAPGASTVITSAYSLPLPPSGTILPRPPLTHTASVSSSAPPDPNPGNNSANVSSRVAVDLDVAVSVSVSASPIAVGQQGTVTIVAGNVGPMPARQVPITVMWPEGFEVVSATATSGTVDAASATWTVPEIGPSDQEELTIAFRPQTPGPGVVRAVAQVPPTDVQAANDAASLVLQAAAAADVAVRLSAPGPLARSACLASCVSPPWRLSMFKARWSSAHREVAQSSTRIRPTTPRRSP